VIVLIDTVNQEPPRIGLVEAAHEVHDRTLPRSRLTDERDRLTGRYFERKIFQNRLTAGIRETDVLEGDPAAFRGL